MTWTELELRKADEEEREFYGGDWIWKPPMPEVDEQVLVSDGVDIWIDTWIAIEEGQCLESAQDTGEGLFWAPLPKLPEKKHRRFKEDDVDCKSV